MNGGGYDEAGTDAEMDPVWLLVCSRAEGGCLTNKNLGRVSCVPSKSLIQAISLTTQLNLSQAYPMVRLNYVLRRNRVSRHDGNRQVDKHRVSRRSKRSKLQP